MISIQNKKNLIDFLYKSEAITFSKDRNLESRPFTTNFKRLSSYPHMLRFTAQLLGDVLKKEVFDLLAGPINDIPLATSVSLEFNWPMIFVRADRKDHGMERLIEGNFHSGQKVIVIDEEITDVSETLRLLGRIEGSGLKVVGMYVLLDRNTGVKRLLANKGYNYFNLIDLNEIILHLTLQGYIDDAKLVFLKKHISLRKDTSFNV